MTTGGLGRDKQEGTNYTDLRACAMGRNSLRVVALVVGLLGGGVWGAGAATPATRPATGPAVAGKGGVEVFRRENLVAWCIVPYDGRKRGPAERAGMLAGLGITKYAYDWRGEHLPTFEAEILAIRAKGIELVGVWFPDQLNKDARVLLDGLKKNGVTTQLWVMVGANTVEEAAGKVGPIAREAAGMGCSVGLYNHGGWFGEPANQVAIIERLKKDGVTNVGMVYNLHHGHAHVEKFGALLALMRPHLMCLNLNGMVRNGEKVGKQIVPIGMGELDLDLLRIIRDSGYAGPIGILNHTNEDAEARLRANMVGLEGLVARLGKEAAGVPAAVTRPSTVPASVGDAGRVNYWSVEDAAERERLPLYQTIPAARVEELTGANGWPGEGEYRDWYRSHGNDGCTRYSPLAEITPASRNCCHTSAGSSC